MVLEKRHKCKEGHVKIFGWHFGEGETCLDELANVWSIRAAVSALFRVNEPAHTTRDGELDEL
jgi:hypothetical protein